MLNRFWDLLEESVIASSVIALTLVITVCIMAVNGLEVPAWLIQALFVVIAFFFGAKTQRAASSRSR